mgnify:CR=1 FL=1
MNLFPTKDKILLDLTETMFDGQFGVARSIADGKLPPVYAYAVDTAIQLTLTELERESAGDLYRSLYRPGYGGIYLCAYHGGIKRDFRREFSPITPTAIFYEMDNRHGGADAQLYGTQM